MIKDYSNNFTLDKEVRATDPWVIDLIREQHLPFSYFNTVTHYFAYIANTLSQVQEERSQALIVGINGSQGSGKSTMSLFLKEILERYYSLRTEIISIDDLYLSSKQRNHLSNTVHPLFKTRGVPGTHDAQGGLKLLDNLRWGRPATIPRFDKANDNPKPRSEWDSIDHAVDVVLFEGWCVGARPEPEQNLSVATNTLESSEDAERIWRSHINHNLANEYAQLFNTLDYLIHLKAPSFECVLDWRKEQEYKLKQRVDANAPGLMDDTQLERFIMHYERLTRWMLKEISERAQITLELNSDHSFRKMSHP